VTVASGVTADAWYNRSVRIRLRATDNAGGTGVKSVTYRIDGGAPVTVLGSSASAVVKVDARTHAQDGSHTVSYFATDVAGNVEATHTLRINVDTRKPSTKAPRSARVRQNETAMLRYAVYDGAPNSKSATVSIVVTNSRGDVVKTLDRRTVTVNQELSASFKCSLRPGTYRFVVKATDSAGNEQANAASQTLTVTSGDSDDDDEDDDD
jgi:hypothetical protein